MNNVRLLIVFVFTFGCMVACNRTPPTTSPPVAPVSNKDGAKPAPAVPSVTAEKEGETWAGADLLAYLRKQGVKCILYEEHPKSHFNPETTSEDLTVVDDAAAVERAKAAGKHDDLKEQKAGTAVVSVIRYNSRATAKSMPINKDGGTFIFGRFLIAVLNPNNPGELSGNPRSRKLVQQMRKAIEGK